MAITYSDYTGDGSNKDFAFSFPYLEDTHVVVEVDGVDKTTTAGDFTLPTTSLVRMTVAPALAAAVRVKRVSDFATDLVDFTNGSVLTEGDLDRAYQHNRYLNEEAAEGNNASMQQVGGGTDFNADNNKIVNLSTPTANLDGANKDYVDTQVALSATNLSGFESSAHTGDNTAVDFTLSFTPQVSTPEAFLVTIDGVVQKPTTAYTIHPDTPKITFTSAPPTSAAINVVAIGRSSTSASSTSVKSTGSTTDRSLGDRFAQVAHVDDFGADNTGATDTTSSIQAAIDSLPTSGDEGHGGVVQFGVGKYKVTTKITIPEHVIVQGMGISATRINGASGVEVFEFTGNASLTEPNGGGLSDMTISCDSITGEVVHVKDSWGFYLQRIRFRDGGSGAATYCVKCSGKTFEIDISQVRFALSGTGTAALYIADDCNNAYIRNCDFGPDDGVDAIHVEDANSVVIDGNHFEYAGTEGGVHIKVNNCIGTKIVNNQIGANEKDDKQAIQITGSSKETLIQNNRISLTEKALTMDGTSRGTVFVGNAVETSSTGQATTNDEDVVDDGGRPDNVFANNLFINASSAGLGAGFAFLYVQGSRTTVSGNVFTSISTGVTGSSLRLGTAATQINVVGNVFNGFAVGVDCDATAGSHQVTLSQNSFTQLTTDATIAATTAVRLSENVGLTTEARGTGTISTGVTSDVITHGLDFTPEDVFITPTENPSNSVGTIWVDTIGATTFTVNCENDPGASALNFNWNAKAL